jgi:hypothetical protein
MLQPHILAILRDLQIWTVCMAYMATCYKIIGRLCKGKAILLQAWTGTEGSRKLRLPYFKIVFTWRWWSCQSHILASFTPQEILLVLLSVKALINPPGHSAAGRITSIKNSSDTIGNWTHDLLACNAVPWPTAPLHTPTNYLHNVIRIQWRLSPNKLSINKSVDIMLWLKYWSYCGEGTPSPHIFGYGALLLII